MGAEKTVPNTQSAPPGTVSLSTAAAARRSRRAAGRGRAVNGSAVAAGRAPRAPHPPHDEAVRVPRAPAPEFADLPELPTLPMLLGIGFWVPGAERPASGGDGSGSAVDRRVSSPTRQGEGRPLPGARSST